MNPLPHLGLGKRTLIMGVLNVTPDSFSDGGLYNTPAAAVARALSMLDEGADIVDVGGESTRPSTFRDSSPLDPDVEIARVLPVIEGIVTQRPGAVVSIDTYKPVVARAALQTGAAILNDVSGLGYDPEMAQIAAGSGAPLILMHMPGRPRQMPEHPQYEDVVHDVAALLRERARIAVAAGVAHSQLVIDPGIGFGKTPRENRELIRRLPEIKALGYPALVGPSRKSFLGALLGDAPADDRLEGTAAAIALCIAGGADIVRVHDVRFMARLARVCDGIVRS